MTALDGCFSTAGLGAEWYKKDVSSPFGILWPMKNGRSDNKAGEDEIKFDEVHAYFICMPIPKQI